jgi:hypothetical protein
MGGGQKLDSASPSSSTTKALQRQGEIHSGINVTRNFSDLMLKVVGVPDPQHNEEIAAWIRLREGERTTAEEMLRFLKGRLSEKYHP